MNRPLTFAYRNVLFGRGVFDAWGLYCVHTASYAGLSAAGKLALLGQGASFAAAVEADFQILRVTRAWSGDDYLDAARATLDSRHGDPDRFEDLLATHVSRLDHRAPTRPEVFLAIELGSDERRGLPGLIRDVGAALGLSDARGVTGRRLSDVLDAERHAFGRAADYLDVERASTRELQWLLRRTATRGAREPWLDRFWTPQAVVLDAEDEDGGLRFEPGDADLLSLLDEPMVEHRDHLAVGDAVQTVLIAGALPETTVFPGRSAELLFSPLEGVGFPVDACFSARTVANDRALALVRKRIVDADHAFHEESHGDHGPTAQTAERPDLVRELEEQLTSSSRPPLLRAQLSLVVGAADIDELEDRVRLLRREFAPIALHRPKDVQLQLWTSHLPAQRPPLRRYDDVFLPEQFGAMVPTATHAVGARTGLLIGHTISGSRQPVLFDITEGSRTSRAPAILCTGTLGSGKTVTAELLAYHAFLGGSQIVDVDPKGDHRLAAVIGEEHVEHIELSADDKYRGMLDPLRIAPVDLRVELAHSFLTELLPSPVPPLWQTEIRSAVAAAVKGGAQSCGVVLDILDGGNEEARAAARAIEVHAGTGLLQLGFDDADSPVAREETKPVTSLRIANLTLPEPGTPRAEFTQEERSGRALLRLLSVHALHLASGDWSRHKVLIIEELSQLVSDAVGLSLLQRIVRLCRSQNATPILATQVVDDVGSAAAAVADMIGCFFAFGVETDGQAKRVLNLLGLEEEDERLRAQLQSYRRGRCLMRDYEGRISPVQIDLADPSLLAALDTTPPEARR
jgi:hypothetical protein